MLCLTVLIDLVRGCGRLQAQCDSSFGAPRNAPGGRLNARTLIASSCKRILRRAPPQSIFKTGHDPAGFGSAHIHRIVRTPQNGIRHMLYRALGSRGREIATVASTPLPGGAPQSSPTSVLRHRLLDAPPLRQSNAI